MQEHCDRTLLMEKFMIFSKLQGGLLYSYIVSNENFTKKAGSMDVSSYLNDQCTNQKSKLVTEIPEIIFLSGK